MTACTSSSASPADHASVGRDGTTSASPSDNASADSGSADSAATSGGTGDGSGSGSYRGTGKNISDISFTVSGGRLTNLTGNAGFFCYPSGYQVQTFDEQDHTTPVNGGQFDDSFQITVDNQTVNFQISGTVNGATASGTLSVKRPYCTTEGQWTAQQS